MEPKPQITNHSPNPGTRVPLRQRSRGERLIGMVETFFEIAWMVIVAVLTLMFIFSMAHK
jgi:hypothetical protein